MPAAVKLADLTDALEFATEESAVWLDRQTGRVVVVDNDALAALESVGDDETPEDLEDWQEDQLPAARGIVKNDPRYLALPTKFDFHEYRHMERFIGTVADPHSAEELWRAIKGRGAFRYFKDTADRLGLLDDWFRYRDAAVTRFMLDWAEVNEVEVDQSPGRAGFP